jgi:acetate kinase
MRVCTLNCGSSSVKFSLFETSRALIARGEDRFLMRGQIERIGQTPSFASISIQGGEEKRRQAVEAPDHESAIRILHDMAIEAVPGEIEAVGHRIVHGGPRLGRSCLVDAEVEGEIEAAMDLAPLHNPHNLAGIRAVRHLLPDCPNVGAFDTGFHRTIPAAASTYALPHDLVRRHNIHRYGFHGLSHRFITYRVENLLKRPREELKIISCHLGNGCSLTAVNDGLSVDTTLGFSTYEGLVMGTRPGDLDAGALLYLMQKENLSINETESLLNRRSGLLGISGVSNDFREILAARARGNEQAELAIEVFCYRIRKYLGAYAAVLGHVDAIAFTGGVGEAVPEVRTRSLAGLASWGVKLDAGANEQVIGSEGAISAPDSAVSVWVIPANEELVIARDTVRCVEDAGRSGWKKS